MPTEYGSPIYAGHRPKADASLVALIRRAGGIAARQDRHHRVRPSRSGQDPQPAQSRAHAGRLVVRLGGRRRRGLLADRDRQPDRRLGDPAGELLRRRGLQAVVSAAADHRHEMRVLASRHRRAVRRRGRRRGLRRRRHQRPRSAGRRQDAGIAAHRRAARPAVAGGQRRHGGRGRERGARRVGRQGAASATSSCRRCWPRRSGRTASSTAYEAARALASEYDRHRDKLGKGMRELVESGFADHAPSLRRRPPHRQPGAPARWPI